MDVVRKNHLLVQYFTCAQLLLKPKIGNKEKTHLHMSLLALDRLRSGITILPDILRSWENVKQYIIFDQNENKRILCFLLIQIKILKGTMSIEIENHFIWGYCQGSFLKRGISIFFVTISTNVVWFYLISSDNMNFFISQTRPKIITNQIKNQHKTWCLPSLLTCYIAISSRHSNPS